MLQELSYSRDDPIDRWMRSRKSFRRGKIENFLHPFLSLTYPFSATYLRDNHVNLETSKHTEEVSMNVFGPIVHLSPM